MVNRLRDVLCGYFPALERAFDYAHSRGALVLLTGHQTPQAIRRTGQSRLRRTLVGADGQGRERGWKVSSLIAEVLAGVDSVDDMMLLRHGGMRRMFIQCREDRSASLDLASCVPVCASAHT